MTCTTYSRVVRYGDQTGVLVVDLAAAEKLGQAIVTCDIPGTESWAVDVASALLDASTDVAPIEQHLRQDRRLAFVASQRGLRIPGTTDAFELAVRSVLGQQISVAGATTLATRVAERFGPALSRRTGSLTHAFPSPAMLAEGKFEGLGIAGPRAAVIRQLGYLVDSGLLMLRRRERLQQTYEQLLSVKGIGPWTASYIALRALGDTDAIPLGDLGLRQVLGLPSAPISSAEVGAAAERWRPYRGYATAHIWTTFLVSDS